MVQDVMTEAAVAYDDLESIVVTRGPGTFAGVRVGLAAARGLALAHDIPVRGVSVFEAILVGHKVHYGSVDHDYDYEPRAHEEHIMVLLNAPRGALYAQLFPYQPSSEKSVESGAQAPFMASPQEVTDLLKRGTVLVGEGVERLRIISADGVPDRVAEWLREGYITLSEASGVPDTRVMASNYDLFQRRVAGNEESEESASPLYLRPPDARLPQRVSGW